MGFGPRNEEEGIRESVGKTDTRFPRGIKIIGFVFMRNEVVSLEIKAFCCCSFGRKPFQNLFLVSLRTETFLQNQ